MEIVIVSVIVLGAVVYAWRRMRKPSCGCCSQEPSCCSSGKKGSGCCSTGNNADSCGCGK